MHVPKVMSNQSLKSKVARGIVWRLVSRLSTQGVTFLVGIVLARLLGPEAYGRIAVLMIFIGMSETLINCGFGAALVQKKSLTEIDLNSVFYLQLFMAVVFYCILFFCAPLIASYYNDPSLALILRVQALILPLNSIRGVQSSVLSRNLWFHYSFRIGLSEVFASAIVGLSMAYFGFGIWALVGSSLASGVAGASSAIFWVRWTPQLVFSFNSIRELFCYGWKLLVSGIVDSVAGDLYGLVIGKFYSPKDLALYNRGRQFPQLAMDTINSSLSTVSFPALSKLQSEPDRMKNAMRQMIQVSTFFVMPMLAGMSATAESIVLLVLGEEWAGAIPYVSIACISFAFYPFHTINLQAIKASGRSDYYLWLSIIKDIVGVIVLFFSCRYGVIVMALAGAFVSTPAGLIINSWPNKILLNYGILSQLSDVIPTLAMSLAMALLTWSIKFVLPCSIYITLVTQIAAGCLFYYGLVSIFRPKPLIIVLSGLPKLAMFFPFLRQREA